MDIDKKGQQEAKLPFEVDRASRTDLPRQVTDGLRAAIRSGFFKPGDILPPVQAMRKALGVSVRAPLEAVRRLQDEGLVASRRHVGVVVLGRNEMSWKGHVLVVYPNVTPVFYKTVLEMRLSDRLLDAGWLTTRIMLRGDEGKGYDLTQLSFALKQPLSLVFVLGDRPRLFKYLRASGIPFAGMPNGPGTIPGAVGGIRTDHHAADGEFAAYCASRGVATLTQYGLDASQSFLSAEAFTEKECALKQGKWSLRKTTKEVPEPSSALPTRRFQTGVRAMQARRCTSPTTISRAAPSRPYSRTGCASARTSASRRARTSASTLSMGTT